MKIIWPLFYEGLKMVDINLILDRAIHDDGAESDIAVSMLRKLAKKQTGSFVFVSDNSLSLGPSILVSNLREEKLRLSEMIENQKKEIEHLKKALQVRGAPKKREATFPWEKYPNLEMRAFEMIFLEKRSMADAKNYILDNVPDASDSSRIINQRFVQNKPNAEMMKRIIVKKDGSDITWDELWRIGTIQHSDNWIQRVMFHGSGWDSFNKGGCVPKAWHKLNPNKFINVAGRRKLRKMFDDNSFPPAGEELIMMVLQAGSNGITNEQLKNQGAGMRRLTENVDKSIIFREAGRLYHYSFAYLFPNNPQAQLSFKKFASK
jgi:hypothetical protein